MAQSPLEAVAADTIGDYLKNWDALSSMIVRGRSFSGFERHCCFLNVGSTPDGKFGRFADVSAATGLDLIDDGRAVATADWDGDGDLDFWVTNREAPRLRFLKNNLGESQRTQSIRFTLEGTNCNRDAIGAVLELAFGGKKHTRVLRAGDGFLSQSSKSLHFGLGPISDDSVEGTLTIRWPFGPAEVFGEITPGATYHIVQGSGSAARKTPPRSDAKLPHSKIELPAPTEKARVLLTHRIKAPSIDYFDFVGGRQRFESDASVSKPILINLWASWCAPCRTELAEFAAYHDRLKAKHLRILALTTEIVTQDGSRPDMKPAIEFARTSNFPFELGATDANGLRLLTVLHNQVFTRERPLPLPSSFLIDKFGNLAAIYKGPVDAEQLLSDVALLEAAPKLVIDASFPFASRDGVELFPIGELEFARAYQAGGYVEDARRHARAAIGAAGDDAANLASAWHYLATLEQSQRNWNAAVDAYRKTTEFAPAPAQALLKIPLGGVLWQAGDRDAANKAFAEAAAARPDDPRTLDALGKVHLQIDRANEAISYFERLVALDADNPQFLLVLGLAHEKAGAPEKAVAIYRQILAANPGALDAKNKLAWLLATSQNGSLRDGKTAKTLATEVNETSNYRSLEALGTLAAAQAETGDYDTAVATIERAIGLARGGGREALVKNLREKRRIYESRNPFRSGGN